MARERTTWFGQGRTRALLSLGMLVGLSAVTTSAYWAETTSVPAGSIESGAMHVDLASNVRVKPESYTWGALSLANLNAGNSRSAVLPVTNNSRGAVTFSYRIQASAPGTLGEALRITVRRGGSSNGTSCSGGTLLGSEGATLAGFDQPAGANLAPGQNHGICVQVTLPANATVPPSSTSGLTFTFPATQVP